VLKFALKALIFAVLNRMPYIAQHIHMLLVEQEALNMEKTYAKI
jgi:hypothetical protein